MERKVYYREGYKYQVAKEYSVQTKIFGLDIKSEFIRLYPTGILVISSGYAWDGASGPTIDTDSSIRGSLVHDALYQLLREGNLLADIIHEDKEEQTRLRYKKHEEIRAIADDALSEICKEDGMLEIRAELWEILVSKIAYGASSQENRKEVLTAGADA